MAVKLQRNKEYRMRTEMLETMGEYTTKQLMRAFKLKNPRASITRFNQDLLSSGTGYYVNKSIRRGKYRYSVDYSSGLDQNYN